MVSALFDIGDKVLVHHSQGFVWEGLVTYRAMTDVINGKESWEYEVSNAPFDKAKLDFGDTLNQQPGCRWSPLVWETEMQAVP